MIDISMGKDEKAYYITNVKMKDDGENFIVFYADGHTEEQEFTAHNYNVYIYRMKHQVLDNRGAYVTTQEFVITMAILKAAKALIYSSAALFFTSGIQMPPVLRTAIIVLAILYNLGYSFKRMLEILDAYIKLTKYKSLEEFVSIMENFRIDIVDPVTGHEEDWYLFNIGDVTPTTNVEALKNWSTHMTSEYKKAESQRISELIKEKFPKRLIKNIKKA